jgi:hypothetical protein
MLGNRKEPVIALSVALAMQEWTITVLGLPTVLGLKITEVSTCFAFI